jgi:adenylate cyclase
MEEDEEWTFRVLNTYKEVIRSLIQQYRGRVVDAPGDNVLAEFTSVVDAVQCGVEIQQVLRAKNAVVPENRRMEFRIGINLGDVIEEGDSIYGDGVNIAARLEGLAEAGGICISESAYQQIENKLPLRYKYLGEHQVKNISKPVRAYQARIEPEGAAERKVKARQWQRATMGLVIGVVVVAAAITMWKLNIFRAPQPEVTSKEKTTAPSIEKPLATMPPATEVVSPGKITPSSTEKVSKPAVPPPKVEATAQSVRAMYNLRKDQQQGKTGEERGTKTEKELEQAEKLKKESGKHEGEKFSQEKYAKASDELNAMDWFRKGVGFRTSYKNSQEAMKAFDKAIELDPNLAIAYAQRAVIYNEWGQHQQAFRESEQAIKLAPNLALGFSARGRAYIAFSDCQKAIEDLSKAIELEPKSAMAYFLRSWAYFGLRNYHRSLEDADKAIEHDPELSYAYFRKGMALASLKSPQEAIETFDKAIELNPMYPLPFYHRGLAFLRLDKKEQALEDLKKAASLGNNEAQDYLKKQGIHW